MTHLHGLPPRLRKERKKVVAWLKVLEKGEARMRQSRAIEPYDFAWMWQELGVLHLRK